jgi:hypothetical protein
MARTDMCVFGSYLAGLSCRAPLRSLPRMARQKEGQQDDRGLGDGQAVAVGPCVLHVAPAPQLVEHLEGEWRLVRALGIDLGGPPCGDGEQRDAQDGRAARSSRCLPCALRSARGAIPTSDQLWWAPSMRRAMLSSTASRLERAVLAVSASAPLRKSPGRGQNPTLLFGRNWPQLSGLAAVKRRLT